MALPFGWLQGANGSRRGLGRRRAEKEKKRKIQRRLSVPPRGLAVISRPVETARKKCGSKGVKERRAFRRRDGALW